jgi:hypothetical protein
MGKKLLVSLAMEGKFSNEGLQGIEDDDDVLTAMARELVTQRGVGESASAVWRPFRNTTPDSCQLLRPTRKRSNRTFSGSPLNELVASADAGLIFGARLEREPPRRRPLIVEGDSQLSLF